MSGVAEVRIIGVPGIPEVRPGDDIAAHIMLAADNAGVMLESGDIVVVTHKIISKSEGQLVDLEAVTPSAQAESFAAQWMKDARQVEVVLRESARIVRMERGVIISETRHGFICANAGVDASNVAGDETVCLLPVDPDASARRLRDTLREHLGVDVAVIVTDSFGRPWREGITNVAIGIAGMQPLTDYRGQIDDHGHVLVVSMLAIADEIAASTELVMGKLDRTPVAVVRGYPYTPGEGSCTRPGARCGKGYVSITDQ